MRVVILGADQAVGRAFAPRFAATLSAEDQLVLAGSSTSMLDSLTTDLVTDAEVAARVVDVGQHRSLQAAFAGADLVVVTGLSAEHTTPAARATLEAGADWFDALASTRTKVAALLELSEEIAAQGRCFITDGGFAPGLPGVLVRWARSELDLVTDANVAWGIRADWKSLPLDDLTLAQIVEALTDTRLTVWVGGTRHRVAWAESPTIDFGPPLGRQMCIPVPLAEFADLPGQIPGLANGGFYVSGFRSSMVSALLRLLITTDRIRILNQVTKRFAQLIIKRLFSAPAPAHLTMRLQARGMRGGRPATATVALDTTDPVESTAIGALAALRQVLSEPLPTGLHLQADVLDPRRCLADLADLGVKVSTRVSPSGSASPLLIDRRGSTQLFGSV